MRVRQTPQFIALQSRGSLLQSAVVVSEYAHSVTSAARVRSDDLSEELGAANARVDTANELAEDLSRQREFHVNEIGSLKAQLVSRLAEGQAGAEVESPKARLSKMALPQSAVFWSHDGGHISDGRR